jgi:hypothetical protein
LSYIKPRRAKRRISPRGAQRAVITQPCKSSGQELNSLSVELLLIDGFAAESGDAKKVSYIKQTPANTRAAKPMGAQAIGRTPGRARKAHGRQAAKATQPANLAARSPNSLGVEVFWTDGFAAESGGTKKVSYIKHRRANTRAKPAKDKASAATHLSDLERAKLRAPESLRPVCWQRRIN